MHGHSLSTPFKLQYLGHTVNGKEVIAMMSDGTHYHEFVISPKYDFLFVSSKVPFNDVITIKEIKKKNGILVIKEIGMTKGQKYARLGTPKKI